METKYYTPKLEEIFEHLLNVGEIFMINFKTNNLSKIQTHPDIVNTLIKFIQMNDIEADKNGINYFVNPENYRIKYLDVEDVESLGFGFIEETENGSINFIKPIFEIKHSIHLGFNKKE